MPFPRRRLAAVVFALATLPASSGAAPPSPQRVVRPVAEGVTLIRETIPPGAADGPLAVSVLRVDRRAPGVRVGVALAQDRVWGTDATKGREIVSALARRRGALGAVNAGYFPFAGNPIGLHIENGELVTEPNARVALVLDARGSARFARFIGAGSAAANGATTSIHGLNRPPGRGNELLLYTPRFFSATLPQPGRFEIVLRDVPAPLTPGKEYEGIVAHMRTGGGAPLAPDSVVLSGGGRAADWLRANAVLGAPLRFRFDIRPAPGDALPDNFVLHEAVAGGPRLLREGRVAINWAEEGFPASFARGRHPRTAVGLTRDGDTLLLVTVDGRQPALSRGATLAELAAILLKLGAWEAINLDGGGSTTLVVRDAIVNAPSEGRERPVANAILVFAGPSAATSRPPVKGPPTINITINGINGASVVPIPPAAP